MIKIGLTGGIGSGKSYIANLFFAYGIPIYNADKEAKRLMNYSKPLKLRIKTLLGPKSYHVNGRLNRAFVADKIFNDSSLLNKMNKLVHPAVANDFNSWSSIQKSNYCIEESAILFENKLNHNFDKIILVVADKKLRVQRIMQRDKISESKVLSRMKQQLPDKKKIPLADYLIYNNEGDDVAAQVKEIHHKLLKLYNND